MMKTIQLIIILSSFLALSTQAQHRLSIYGGWTISKIQQYGDPGIINKGIYADFYALPALHAAYLSMEYEYELNPFILSTGLSLTTYGSREFAFKDHILGEAYLNIPLIVGIKWNLVKNWELIVEAGLEPGISLGYTGPIKLGGNLNKFRGNISFVTGVEVVWRNFRLGTRVQIGVTKYQDIGPNREVTLRHSALTTYIGYTFWDSKQAKKRRAKRLAKKNLEIE